MTARLRVALIASNRFPISQPFAGGLESHVWHLARTLARQGHDVVLFAAEGSDPDLRCGTMSVHRLTLSPAAQQDSSMPAETFMADHHAYLTLMLRLSGANAERFDIIHNHSLHHLPVAMAPLLSTPMLTTVHTPPTPWLESAVKATGAVGTRFVAVSRHTAASWQHVIDDMTVVPNGVDSRCWPPGTGGGSLVWFGRLTPEKGTHLAIAAARRAGLRLNIAGPVADAAYFTECIAPELDDDIRYLGHLDQQALAALVGSSAAALVTPLWDEPYGLVVAEAMSCGTPVVAFASGGVPEIVDPLSGRLVCPGDVEAMAAAVPQVLALDRERVRRHAMIRCAASVMVDGYLRLYRAMINEAKNGKHDRLLHPSSGAWSPEPSHQRLPASARTGHGADIARGHRAESVRGHRDPDA